MLDDCLEDQCLFYGGVVCAEACLCWCVQVKFLGGGGKSLVDGGHEDLSEWGRDGDASVVFWVFRISFSFVKGDNFGCLPRCWWFLYNCAGIQEFS
jgi:hypothetical protein